VYVAANDTERLSAKKIVRTIDSDPVVPIAGVQAPLRQVIQKGLDELAAKRHFPILG
jgi:hypothetical protein